MSPTSDDERLAIERARLELDIKRYAGEQRFTSKHLATIVTALVSLAAVVVSVSQVVVAYTAKQKEIEQSEKAHMRDWNLKAAEFVAAHQDLIFGADIEKRARITGVMLATFPPDITKVLFQKLADAGPGTEAQSWAGALTAASKLLPGARACVETPAYAPVDLGRYANHPVDWLL